MAHEELEQRQSVDLHDAWMEFFSDVPMEQLRPYILVTGTRR